MACCIITGWALAGGAYTLKVLIMVSWLTS